MVDVEPVLLGVDAQQRRLGFGGGVGRRAGQLQHVRDAEDVRVHGDALCVAEGLAHDHVGGFAANAGKLLQQLHVLRDLPAEFGEHGLRQLDQVACLGMEESQRMDDRLDLFHACGGHLLGRAEALEQLGRHLVHGGVGALGGKHHRAGERERVGVVQ